MKRAALLVAVLLSACGPIPLDQAERQCLDRARLAQQPRGEIGVGVTSDGKAAGSFEVNISSDFIMGRDPSAVYDMCVYQKSGLAPSRPLYSFPEWKG